MEERKSDSVDADTKKSGTDLKMWNKLWEIGFTGWHEENVNR